MVKTSVDRSDLNDELVPSLFRLREAPCASNRDVFDPHSRRFGKNWRAEEEDDHPAHTWLDVSANPVVVCKLNTKRFQGLFFLDS